MKKNLLLVTFLLLMILICTGCSDSWENHFERRNRTVARTGEKRRYGTRRNRKWLSGKQSGNGFGCGTQT